MPENYNMWKELNEVPELIRYNLTHFDNNTFIDFKTLNINDISNIKLIASGSSNNASQTGRFIFEEIIQIPTTIEYSSEFAHKNFVLGKKTLVIGVSQSGKTADTLAALKKIKSEIGCHILGLTNVKSSEMFKISDSKILIGAGEERAIPATKSFSLQLLALFNLALLLAKHKNINVDKTNSIREELFNLPGLLFKILEKQKDFEVMASKIIEKEHLTILARGENHSIAREGALKFKETSYIDANGYSSGEFMHGYFALLDNRSSVVVLEYLLDEFLIANVLKLKQKSDTQFYGITMNPDKTDLYNDYILIPATKSKLVSTFAFATSLQMIAFFAACKLGYNPDKPRSLTKYLKKEK